MISVVIRETSYLKVLHPIMNQFNQMGVKYVVHHFDAPRGPKEYNRASLKNLMRSSGSILKHAYKIKAFSNDAQLLKQLKHDKITKIVSLEIWLWAKSYLQFFRKNNIKTCSISYLTDSLWQPAPSITTMDRVYYSTPFIMSKHQQYAGVKYNPERDRCFGSPIFDGLKSKSSGDKTLVLLPNMGPEYVKKAFGSESRFNTIIDKVCAGTTPIFKARKKQWIPSKIKSSIVYDGDCMYPPVVSDLFDKCSTTVMFWSSGIYEAVYAGNYVINIEMPLSRWSWSGPKMDDYFRKSGLYSFGGVVETRTQEQALVGTWVHRKVDEHKRKEWVSKFVGSASNCAYNMAKNIIK